MGTQPKPELANGICFDSTCWSRFPELIAERILMTRVAPFAEEQGTFYFSIHGRPLRSSWHSQIQANRNLTGK